MEEILLFITFIKKYVLSRTIMALETMGIFKNIIVHFLLLRRGKYANSFLNTSFIVLLALIFVSAPTIAQNNPFRSDSQVSLEDAGFDFNERVIGLDEADISIDTIRNKTVRDKVEVYQVASGDTVASLAKKFSISESTIQWANKLSPGARLRVGSKLKIPPVTGVTHTVSAGDNIYALARKYQVSPQNIVNFPFNEFKDSSFTLVIGSTLVVPEGSIVESGTKIQTTYSFAQVSAGVKGSSSFIWPTNGVITQYPASYHMALDIANSASPPVISADTGSVIFAGCFNWGYGCHIIVDHNNGFKTLYGHLSRIDVSQGQVINQGQQIGQMGSTGRSTGTHLHFEIRQNDATTNPLSYLR